MVSFTSMPGNQFFTRSTAIATGAVGMKPEDVVIHQYWIGGGIACSCRARDRVREGRLRHRRLSQPRS